MSITENVPHSFNLSGMVAGDWFLGCSKCRQQYPKNAVGFPVCSHCAAPMGLFTVTEQDVRELSRPLGAKPKII